VVWPALLLTVGLHLSGSLPAPASPPAVALKAICNNVVIAPTAITNAGDGSKRIFVCDQVGKIWIIQDEMLLPAPFLDISSEVIPLTTNYDERGLLSVAFHPDFANSAAAGFRKFYVFYSAVSPNAVAASTPNAVAPGSPCAITTSAAHGLHTGDVVTIANINGGSFSPSIDGTFSVTFVDATHFTVPVTCNSNSGVTFTGAQVFPNNPVNCRSTLSEFQVSPGNPNVANPGTERIVMAWDKPQLNHNGGQLAFSPVDHDLYITVGDGGSQHDNDFGHTGGNVNGGTQFIPTGNLGNAQDLTKLLGKILRIDPLGANGPGGAYGIPADNPFAGIGGGVRPEIYAFGLRNPWRLSFDTDPMLGTRLIEGDVGQDTIEEVNLIVSGGNYGWRVREGTIYHDSTSPSGGGAFIDPVLEYAHLTSPVGPISNISVANPCTVTTPTAHNLANGASITVSNVTGGSFSPSINGSFTATVTSPTQFTVPVACSDNSGITYTNAKFTYTTGLPKIGVSVIGGNVYRGSAVPALTGQYVFAEYSANGIGNPSGLLLTADSSTWALVQPTVVGTKAFYITALGPDESGELYVATKTSNGPNPASNPPNGIIYKIVPAQTFNVALTPSQDNSIFSESSALSNALGDLFAGETGTGSKRRGLLKFDIASNVPAGAAISSAQLTLTLNHAPTGAAATMSLFKTSQSWGEGTSGPANGTGATATVGDATWGDRFYDPTSPTLWGVAGGTHITTASATASVGTALGAYSWSSTQMATDVTSWLNTPANNFGWLLVGDETTITTAREFYSREAGAGLQPALQISYAVAPALTWRETWLQTFFAPSVNGVPTIGKFVDDSADANSNGVSNLLEYAWAYNPTMANSPSPGILTTVISDGTNTTYTMTFRRDPRAVDLTYLLQTSNDLVNWTTIVQSAGGAVPTGGGFVSEADVPAQSPVKNVTASETFPSPVKHFSRLQIQRATQ
jgi:hypothetical protein